MRNMVLGALAGAALLLAASIVNNPQEVLAERVAPPYQAGPGDTLIAVPALGGDKHQLLTVVDPRQRVISVYQIEFATGKIKLTAVRNINWDLQMTYWNNESPLPQEIRSMLEQK